MFIHWLLIKLYYGAIDVILDTISISNKLMPNADLPIHAQVCIRAYVQALFM